MNKNYLLKLSFFLLLLFCTTSQAWAEANDPLGKPNVWNRLKQSPVDSVLWAQYFGKAWACMSFEETDNISKWSQDLLHTVELEHHKKDDVAWDDPNDHVGGKLEHVDDAIEAEKKRLALEMQTYERDLEKALVQEPTQLQNLKKNIRLNFVIIEEIYEEEFDKLGQQYVWYEDEHPDRKYSKATWVEEKEKQLRAFKKAEFKKQKASLVRNNY